MEDKIMKKFLISVNGTQYEVDVEEVSGETATVTAPKTKEQPVAAAAAKTEAKAPAAAQAPKPKPAPQQPSEFKAGSETISCPMPGTVLKVAVKAGQTVKKNQLLVVIEAMKMENEIVSPRDAVIAGVMVTKGSTLNAGEPMISLE
jgi:glutaconyl-CoA decarboxylase